VAGHDGLRQPGRQSRQGQEPNSSQTMTDGNEPYRQKRASVDVCRAKESSTRRSPRSPVSGRSPGPRRPASPTQRRQRALAAALAAIDGDRRHRLAFVNSYHRAGGQCLEVELATPRPVSELSCGWCMNSG